MGPGPFRGFMPGYPLTPMSATPMGHEGAIFRRSTSLDAPAAHREQEAALWHHQQLQAMAAAATQQKQLEEIQRSHAAAAAAQQQLPHMIHPASAHPHPHGFLQAQPHVVDHGQPSGLVFNYPSPEEMATRQRLEQLGMLPPGVPPGMHPGFIMENPLARLEEHGGVLAAPHLMPTLPPNMQNINMELLAQQQAAMASGMSPLIPTTPESIMEFQRHFDSMMLSVQKDPSLLQHPHVQLMIHQHQRLQGAAMHEHFIQQMQMSYKTMQEIMIQNHQEFQKQIALGRAGHEDTPRGIRPGVIVQPK